MAPMLSPAENALLREFKGSLRKRFGERLRSLKLFGSRARGSGRDDSDLDVLVDIRDVTAAERGEILDLAADLTVEQGLVLSPLVVRDEVTSVSASIVREAIPL
jgi:predicted nucleotidyltransferase